MKRNGSVRKATWLVLTLTAGVAGAAITQAGMRIVVNGQATGKTTVVVRGETYVPVSVLKSLGVTVSQSGGTLSVTTAQGGANQVGAVEGCMDEWLFNGIWRFRVLGVTHLPAGGRPGWVVRAEIRNGTTANGVALAGTGYRNVTLALDNGQTVSVANAATFRDSGMIPGAARVAEMVFYSPDAMSTPAKLVMTLDPARMNTSFKVKYTVPDPSFRVQLDCVR